MQNKKIILIGGSAGSFRVVNRIIPVFPPYYENYVVFCLHRLKNIRHGFVEALSVNALLPLKEPLDKEPVKTGILYLAPANYHIMTDHSFHFSLSVEETVNHSRPSIDILFETAAEVYGDKCIGIILSGANSDGAKGMEKIKHAGGVTVIQDPEDCEMQAMPDACLRLFNPDHILNADKIINFIRNLT